MKCTRLLQIVLPAFLFTSFLFAGGQGEAQGDGEITVVTTTSIVSDVVAQVAGDKVTQIGLIDYGEDPHGFEPTPKDMAAVEDADILFVNGFGLEEQLIEMLEDVSSGPIIEVSQGVDEIDFDMGEHHHDEDEHHHDEDEHHHDEDEHHHDEDEHHHDDEDEHHHDEDEHHHDEDEHHHDEDEHHHDEDDHHHDAHHHHSGPDPHTWMSPKNVMVWVENIIDALAEADPENAEYYRQNGAAYMTELQELDRDIREKVATIPAEKRVLFTDHRAFNYFARDYGFRLAGEIIPSFSTNAEVSAKELAEVITVIREEEISAIFVGNTAGEGIQKLSQTIKDEIEVPVQILDLLTGSLQAIGEEADSYIGSINYNVNQMVAGLEG